jgi:hypothetical protein
VATCNPFSAEQPAAKIVGIEQVAEAAHRSLVWHRFAAEIDPAEPAHRLPMKATSI